MPTFSPESLLELSCELFEAVGVPADDAKIVATHLVGANLAGHDSHGVMRVPQYTQFLRVETYHAKPTFTILQETPAVVAADAGWGLGQVQANRLLKMLIPKANALGVASGTLRNCGHIGRLGDYAEQATALGLLFFATVNSHGAGRRVAPPGGTEGRISTNPICMAAPTAAAPVVLDFGTSVAAEGKVRVYHQKQQPTPEGWLLDHAGQPTTEAGVLYSDPRGTILPFGGAQAYKGFGLGLLLDLFSGGLSGGQCSNPTAPMAGVGNTVLFTLHNPELFAGHDAFMEQSQKLTAYVRSCPTRDADTRITLPGDPEQDLRQTRTKLGIEIPDGTWKLFEQEAETLKLSLARYTH